LLTFNKNNKKKFKNKKKHLCFRNSSKGAKRRLLAPCERLEVAFLRFFGAFLRVLRFWGKLSFCAVFGLL
jgi:hypothetical protein